MQNLKIKLENKSATLGVIGLGYVGLPLAVEKAKAGFKTIGFDTQEARVKMVNAGENYIGDVVNEDLEKIVRCGKLSATNNFARVAEADCVCICVPTPLDNFQQPDISLVRETAENIVSHMHEEMLIVLESTTYPGTTEEFLKPILESSGLRCGKDFYLAFSPERVDPGNRLYNVKNTPKVVGGITEACTEVAAALYENILETEVHRVSSPSVAEMEKILENTYRNVNIGLINEMALLCDKMNISIWEVIEAAKTKPFGFEPFYPGPGLGGHCIPLDPYYLTWKARAYGFHTSMIESSMIINDRMPEYCVERASKILNRFSQALRGSKILVLGVAYKRDVSDCRESPALKVIEHLEKAGADISYFDPFVSQCNNNGRVYMSEKELSEALLKSADLVLVTTAHSDVDYEFVQKHARAIFDTKNVMGELKDRDNIEVL